MRAVLLHFPHATNLVFISMKTTGYWIKIWQTPNISRFSLIHNKKSLRTFRTFFVGGSGLKSQEYSLTTFGELCPYEIPLLLSTWSAIY